MSTLPSIVLPVPTIKQDKHMSCWYASGLMVLGFNSATRTYHQVDIAGALANDVLYLENQGLTKGAVAQFARRSGLRYNRTLVTATGGSPLNAAGYAKLLGQSGPLWCACLLTDSKGAKYGHAIVMVGARGNDLLFNDPAPGVAQRRMSTTEFNDSLIWSCPNLLFSSAGPLAYFW